MALTSRVARCSRCYHVESEHVSVRELGANGDVIRLCPTAIYQSPPSGQVHRVNKDVPVTKTRNSSGE
jgi:hypothetical protein